MIPVAGRTHGRRGLKLKPAQWQLRGIKTTPKAFFSKAGIKTTPKPFAFRVAT